jgi:cytochrome c oxidase cbb3-type subunit 3
MSKAPVKQEPETTGHSWDGIEEYNNPLPRWWLWTLYATILWAIGYVIAYPAWPLINGATTGLLGYSTRAEVAAEIAAVDAANAGVTADLAAADLSALTPGTPVHDFAVNAGAAVFRAHCSQCHGSGAAGATGYPNLLDDDWLWGGDPGAILTTITHGIRNTTDDDARYSEMPKFGADEMLEPAQIEEVVEYTLQISGQDHDPAMAARGRTIFVDDQTCPTCHGADGRGDRDFGAPNLTDAIWLYGGDRAALTETVANALFGVWPAWGPGLP